MAISKDSIKNTYPLPVYNYQVSIGDTDIACSEVNGLAVEYEPIVYRHGLSWREGNDIMPGMKQSMRITMKKGLVKKGQVLYDWLDTVKKNKVTKKDVLVRLCNEVGDPVITWQVLSAVPLKLTAPSFDASSNDVAFESLEVMAHDVSVIFH